MAQIYSDCQKSPLSHLRSEGSPSIYQRARRFWLEERSFPASCDCSWGGNFSLFLAVPFPVIAIAFPVIFCERTGKKYPKNQRRRGTRRRLSIRKSRFPCIFPCFYRRDRFAADCVVSQPVGSL